MKTYAMVLEKIGHPLVPKEIEIPPLLRGQVLVEIKYSCICGTQLNELMGKKGHDHYLPHTLGHEGSGIVMDIGPGVEKVRAGDQVVLTWLKGHGLENPSVKYGSENQVINSGPVSTFLKHAVISENRIIPAKGIPMEYLPLFGCALPTGLGIIRHTLKAKKDQSIAIWGVGGIGLSALIGSKMQGLNPIIAIDVSEEKLQLARELGATHTLNSTMIDPVKGIAEILVHKGVDFVVEAVGLIQTMEQGFQCIKYQGGVLVIAGNPPFSEKMSIDPMEFIKGKRIVGTWGGESDIEKDIPFYIEAALSGGIPLHKLITHRFPLEEINEAINLMIGRKAGRILLTH